MIQIETSKRTLKLSKESEPSLIDGRIITNVMLTYRRPVRRWGAKKKAVTAALVTLAIWVAFNALVMTDIPDTQPTVSILTQGQR